MKTGTKFNPTVPYQDVNKAGGDYKVSPGGRGGGASKARSTTPMGKVGPIGSTTKKVKPTISKMGGGPGSRSVQAKGAGSRAVNPKPTAGKFSGKASGRDVNLNGKTDAKPTNSRFPGGK